MEEKHQDCHSHQTSDKKGDHSHNHDHSHDHTHDHSHDHAPKTEGTATFYQCKEHPEQCSRTVGTLCPICKEEMQPSKAPHYICTMCKSVVSIKPGNCPLCGMTLVLRNGGKTQEKDKELATLIKRFIVSVVFNVPLLLTSDVLPLFASLLKIMDEQGLKYLQGILALPILTWAAWPFYQKAYQSIINRRANMFTLITSGVFAAVGYSSIITFFPQIIPQAIWEYSTAIGGVYFETAATIVTLVLLGQILEKRAHKKTRESVESLIALTPDDAIRITKSGEEETVSIDQVLIKDRLRIRPGDRIPVDGVVVEGTSNIDESMVTGEPIPVEKEKDSHVIAGTLNQNGSLIIEAQKVGSETMLARIVELVEQASLSRPPVQRLVDQISAYFVPIVFVIAIASLVSWIVFAPINGLAYGIICAVSVLIIACPCALGVATPISIAVGTGRGAKEGLLFRNVRSLEGLSKVNMLILDKTGTLTEGKPRITSLNTFKNYANHDVKDFFAKALTIEQTSSHPLALSFIRYGKAQQIAPAGQVTDVENFIGRGVVAKWSDKDNKVKEKHLIGNQKWMEENKVVMDEGELQAIKNEQGQKSVTIVFHAIEGKIAAYYVVEDAVKEDSFTFIRDLKKEGVKVVLASGDSAAGCTAVANRLGIEEFYSSMLPENKAELIKEKKKLGFAVGMVGDGINDAPAFAESDTSIAMGDGSDTAIENGDVVLMHNDLKSILNAIQLSKKTMANIKQNLFFAFFYNVLGIPIAAGVLFPLNGLLLSPILAALAMALSDVMVIGNALRLKTVKLYYKISR